MKANGYKYDNKSKQYAKETTNIIDHKEPTSSIYDNDMPASLPTNLKKDLFEIVQMKEDLREVIKAFKEGYAKEPINVIEIVEDKGIKISLPKGEIVRTTVRANNTVLNLWNEFCSTNKEFSKQDLLSMAMLKYIEIYSK